MVEARPIEIDMPRVMAAAEQGRGWIDTLRVMWRRKLVVLAVAAPGTLAAAVLAVSLTPRFSRPPLNSSSTAAV